MNDYINDQWLLLKQVLLTLEQQLLVRMEPAVEQLRPIWSDPLWQFIGLIVALIVIFVAVAIVLKASGSLLTPFIDGVLVILAAPINALKKLWHKLWKPKEKPLTPTVDKSHHWLQTARVKRGMDVVRYLTTRRKWRYQTPWYLLTGTESSGKTPWVEGITQGRRTHLLAREKRLLAQGSGWHFFDDGVIIDVESDKTSEQSSHDKSNFEQIVSLLTSYRPERPVDGIILCVSAAALLEAEDDPTELQKVGERLYQQLWFLQKETGFVVPVYLQITECEHVEGFQSFWSSQPKHRLDEMFGWSNPTRLDTAFSSSWVKDAFEVVAHGIQNAQLQVAANGSEITDIDGFMLFDREFQRLQTPLQQVVDGAFARSSFQEALPLRGIWFSGRVDGQGALSQEFVEQKLWPETHLAYPIEKRRFSTNKTLRHFQYATLATAILLLVTMAIDTARLYHYTQEAEKSWAHIAKKQPDCSDSGTDTWWLLSKLTKMGQQPLTLSLPASWGGGQIPALVDATATRVYPNLVFNAMSCRLTLRAEALNSLQNNPIDTSASSEILGHQMQTFVNTLSQYQQAQKTFIRLAGPLPNNIGVAEDFRWLLDYLYDGSIPATIIFPNPLIQRAVVETAYDIEFAEDTLVHRREQLVRLNDLSYALHERILDEALNPPVGALRRAFFPDSSSSNQLSELLKSGADMRNAIDDFNRWLNKVEKDWLTTFPENSPCGKLNKQTRQLHAQLQEIGFPADLLDESVAYFELDQCDAVVRAKLKKLNVDLLGKLFDTNTDGRLVISSGLQQWRQELEALESFSAIAKDFHFSAQEIAASNAAAALNGPDLHTHDGTIVAWKSASLNDAIDLLMDFQSFKQRWWQTDKGIVEPFYASALNNRLRVLVRELIRRSMLTQEATSAAPLEHNRDPETQLAARINSFETAANAIRQLRTLLHQERQSANDVFLTNSSREFVLQQLDGLELLVVDNHLYQPVSMPEWQGNDFATALFTYSSPADLNSYLASQRQRVAYIAQHYSRPLVGYLLDSGGVTQTDTQAQLWMDTLRDLRRYERKEPNSGVTQLENFVSDKLASLSNQSCNSWLATPRYTHSVGGLFANSHYQLDSRVRKHCEHAGSSKVIKRYLALADQFNNNLAGYFPFASMDQVSRKEASVTMLDRFFNDYQAHWGKADTTPGLLHELKELHMAKPGMSLDGWIEFVRDIDALAEFWHNVKANQAEPELQLHIEFAALPARSKGTQEIVSWQLGSGQQQLSFPNGGQGIAWQPGDQLSLALQWASGSDYVPTHNLTTQAQIDARQRMAIFHSEGRWGLFEWLQQYGHSVHDIADANLLTFSVPVVNGETTSVTEQPSYTSRANLLVSYLVTNKDGSQTRKQLPAVLPRLAPEIPDKKSQAQATQQGGKRFASAQN